jgi:signal transduction histidine kinase
MATISAREQGPELVLEVMDDGVGGAQMANGSGLAGLKDRVTALGGRLTIESAHDSGTTVKASIPCE